MKEIWSMMSVLEFYKQSFIIEFKNYQYQIQIRLYNLLTITLNFCTISDNRW